MIIACDHCGKQGTLNKETYEGKRLRLRCPYCRQDFVFLVPLNGLEDTAIDQTIVAHSPQVIAPVAAEPSAPPAIPPPAPEPVHVAPPIPEPVAPPPPPPPAPPPAPAADDAAVHDAKRIARLIISEIKLYNQDKLARLSSRKEVLALLKNDLMKGKQHYDGRVASKLPSAGPDYFMETVKEILLAGKT